MIITAILPVSRTRYLDRVLDSLLKQTLKPNNLIVIYDGPANEFVDVRNKIAHLKLESKLCVKSKNTTLAFNIPVRRLHITGIHNHFRELIGEADWVFSIEDDGILPPHALERLVGVAEANESVGMVTGVELGRWGTKYVGAWTADNVANPTLLTSLDNKSSDTSLVEPIDACGLYCALIDVGQYKRHEFSTRNGLGPDVNLGLFMRKHGFNNYIDWGIHVTHLTTVGDTEIEIHPTEESRKVKIKLLTGNVWQINT